MKFLAKHKGVIAVAAAVVLVLSFAVSSFFTKGRASPLASGINTVFAPLHALIGSVSDYFGNISRAVNDYDALMIEYERLRGYVANMEEELRHTNELTEENERLRTLLGQEPRVRDFVWKIASVVMRDISDFERTLSLSKGSEEGIEAGQCVLSHEMYLVGIVSEVGHGWATVRTVADTRVSAGAKVERTGQTAVAEGNWSLMRDGRLKLSYLPLGSDVRHGDRVLTSGLGGVYPPGIPIGTVASVQPENTGQTEYAEVVPLAELDILPQVFVVLDYVNRD